MGPTSRRSSAATPDLALVSVTTQRADLERRDGPRNRPAGVSAWCLLAVPSRPAPAACSPVPGDRGTGNGAVRPAPSVTDSPCIRRRRRNNGGAGRSGDGPRCRGVRRAPSRPPRAKLPARPLPRCRQPVRRRVPPGGSGSPSGCRSCRMAVRRTRHPRAHPGEPHRHRSTTVGPRRVLQRATASGTSRCPVRRSLRTCRRTHRSPLTRPRCPPCHWRSGNPARSASRPDPS